MPLLKLEAASGQAVGAVQAHLAQNDYLTNEKRTLPHNVFCFEDFCGFELTETERLSMPDARVPEKNMLHNQAI